MSACEQLAADASLGAAPALRAVDCLSNEAAASAFGRLFGTGASGSGVLLPALTIMLTLYIAFFAVSLLTGRSRIGIASLTPRMLTLGLVLTFATSWIAWQQVVWNLAIGAPDQLAGILMGVKGQATQIFASRIDLVLGAISEAAAPVGDGTAQAAQNAGSFTPPNLMWLGALLLLLGTVGVLVTARIALAVLLALGPVFVILALFGGTRGLTAGWLRGVVMTAITPLFVVAGGSLMLELLVPVIAGLRGPEGIDPRGAMALFLIAAVHVALMGMVMKVTATIVGSWNVFGLASSERGDGRNSPEAPQAQSVMAASAPLMTAPAAARGIGYIAAPGADAAMAANGGTGAGRSSSSRTVITQITGDNRAGLPPLPKARARGIGSRFASRPSPVREMIR